MNGPSRIGGRRVLIIAALATAVIIGYVASQSLQSAAVYYYTPTEAKQHGFATGQLVRLGGQIMAGTLVYDAASRDLRFTISDVRQAESVAGNAPIVVEHKGCRERQDQTGLRNNPSNSEW